jgi:hypothetical protein
MGIDKTIATYEREKAANGGQLPPEEEQALQNLKYQQLAAKAVPANGVTAGVMGAPTPMANAATAAQGPGGAPAPAPAAKKIVQTGSLNGRKVVKYSDGSIEYAN